VSISAATSLKATIRVAGIFGDVVSLLEMIKSFLKREKGVS